MAFCYRARTPGPEKAGLFTECQGGIVSLHPKEIQVAGCIYLFTKSHDGARPASLCSKTHPDWEIYVKVTPQQRVTTTSTTRGHTADVAMVKNETRKTEIWTHGTGNVHVSNQNR